MPHLKLFEPAIFITVFCLGIVCLSARSSHQQTEIDKSSTNLNQIGIHQPVQCLKKNTECQNDPELPRCCDGLSCFEKRKKRRCKKCKPAKKRCKHNSWCCEGLLCQSWECVPIESPPVSPTTTPLVSQSGTTTPSVSSSATSSEVKTVTASPSASTSAVASASVSPTPTASSSTTMLISPPTSSSFSVSLSPSVTSSVSASYSTSGSPSAAVSLTPSASFSLSISPSATMLSSPSESPSPTPSQTCLAIGAACREYVRPFCCNSLFCTDGKCSDCLGIGKSCNTRNDCCENEILKNGKTYPCISYRCVTCGQEWGINCKDDDDCCAGLKCVFYTGSGSRKRCQDCLEEGQRCLVDDQCCDRCINWVCSWIIGRKSLSRK